MQQSKSFWVMGGVFAFAVVIVFILLGPDAGVVFLTLTAVVGLYLWLCTLVGIAANRKGRSEGTWFLLAFLFGIVLPAIIIAIMAPQPVEPEFLEDLDEYKDCPFCGEEILFVAKKCKHCGEFFDANSPANGT